VALCGVVAGAVVEVSGSSTIEVNGVLTDCDYVNLGPVLFGPVAVVAGLWAVLARKRRPPARRPLELGLGLACATLGVFQVLAGLGILGGVRLSLDAGNPC
jgi:hypothetical protein